MSDPGRGALLGIGMAALLASGLPAAAAVRVASPHLIPQPAELIMAPGEFTVRADTAIVVSEDTKVQQVGAYFAALLHSSGAPALRVRPQAAAARGGTIRFQLDPAASDAPEAYAIEIDGAGVVVAARSPGGLFYGAVTLWQLCTAALAPGPIRLPALHLKDAPRFAWRGLMLDSARHFQSPDFILRYIDWMALHKLNVLAWHLTDDQGWRLEIKQYPRLTQIGAWRVPAGRAPRHDIDPATGEPRLYGGFYSQEDVRRIVAHAAARQVTIVPEIDLPGHVTAALVAYPELGAADPAPAAVPADWGIYPNLLNADEATFVFLERVLDEVMSLFPGRYVHVGGDEVMKEQWQGSARVQARMRELGIPDTAALQGYFTARLGDYLRAHGRQLVGWDEILQGGAPPGAVVVSWRGVQGAVAAAAAGHEAVLAPDPVLYFDNRQGSSAREPPGRGRVVTLRDVYEAAALPEAVGAGREHLLGLQGNLWTEHVRTEERAAYMTYPRAAALAEIAWSQPGLLSWANFRSGLPSLFARYRALGIPYSADVLGQPPGPLATQRHMSQDLRTCSDQLVLSLEDDAPLHGPRAVFLIDVMNPCWVFPGVDLSHPARLTAAVGQVPFNFQLGHQVESIKLTPPATPSGELEVHVDGCEGAPAAVLSLGPALHNDAVTRLPPTRLPVLPGQHDLCFRFTQARLDPLWALDWVQVSP